MKNKIKILVVLSGLSAGGAETMYMNIYRKLDKNIYEIDFLTFGTDKDFYAPEVLKCGSKIIKMNSIKNSGIKGFYTSIEEAIIKNGPYDVVHSHIDYLSGFIMKAAKRCGVKTRIAHSHNTSADTCFGKLPYVLMKYVQMIINKNSTKKLACSYEAARFMFGEKKSENSIIINNAIDLKRFVDKGQYEKSDIDKYCDKKIILHIGRFVKQKNHKWLIEFFNDYKKINKNVVLLLVGTGELEAEVVKQVSDYNLTNDVLFLGVRSDIPELLSKADVLILPSEFEGVPVTLIEAQAMNVPCVVSDCVKRDVDCGLDLISFVSLEDRKSWCEAVENAINCRNIRNNYDVMTKCGYNIDDNIRTMENLYSGR